ncbi:MAG: MOFRL family protein, partial [Aggregatilineales bacterium]
LAERARQLAAQGGGPAILILGGETTVTVRGDGRGGRNQELALAAALALDGAAGIAVTSFATDGVDGPTDAAGAIVTGETVRRAREMGLDARNFLQRNDSYTFFERVGGLIRLGPTGTNVNDVALALVY